MRWSQGEAIVERLIAERHIQKVTGAQADGSPWLERARRTVETADAIAADDPDSAYVLAYDAARQACGGLLAQQGLRPTTSGGHYAVEEVIRAQFGPVFRAFGTLRRRRNELEYPTSPGDRADPDEAAHAVQTARQLIDAVQRLLPELGIF
jgi:hypothetical protein